MTPEFAATPKQAGQRGRTVLAFTDEAWAAFTAALKGGAVA